jgi:uncharacterized protein (DUF1810 family)
MDSYDLQRFRTAQSHVYSQVLYELKDGHKRTHWMWFVFPQVEGLGESPMAIRYAIGSADEARAYLADPLLGTRIRECTRILGYPDDLKFRSSMTLFAAVSGEELFGAALEKFFGGKKDPRTLAFLKE